MKVAHSESGDGSKRMLLQRQGGLLRRYLEQTVLPFSKYYSAFANDIRSVRSVEDLRNLPFAVKRDLQNSPRDFILIPDEKVLAKRPSTILRALWHGRDAVKD